MSPIKRTKHAVYDVKYHFVWVPKYRKKILAGEVAEYARQIFLRIALRVAKVVVPHGDLVPLVRPPATAYHLMSGPMDLLSFV